MNDQKTLTLTLAQYRRLLEILDAATDCVTYDGEDYDSDVALYQVIAGIKSEEFDSAASSK